MFGVRYCQLLLYMFPPVCSLTGTETPDDDVEMESVKRECLREPNVMSLAPLLVARISSTSSKQADFDTNLLYRYYRQVH